MLSFMVRLGHLQHMECCKGVIPPKQNLLRVALVLELLYLADLS